MKNHRLICAALATGAVLGAAAASLLPHAAAAPAAATPDQSVNARLAALETKMSQLDAKISVIDARAAAPETVYAVPAPSAPSSNIPKSYIILLKTPPAEK